MKIDHINIAAPMELMEEVRDFYCYLLELEVGDRPDFGIPGYWLYGDGHPIIHLIESPNHGASDKPYYLDHVAFGTKGIGAYIERLKQRDIAHSINHIEAFGISQVFCHDPCGIGVEANFSGETPPN